MMTPKEINACAEIQALRACTIAYGHSAAWFDMNGYGESVRLARVAAHKAHDQWLLGYPR